MSRTEPYRDTADRDRELVWQFREDHPENKRPVMVVRPMLRPSVSDSSSTNSDNHFPAADGGEPFTPDSPPMDEDSFHYYRADWGLSSADEDTVYIPLNPFTISSSTDHHEDSSVEYLGHFHPTSPDEIPDRVTPPDPIDDDSLPSLPSLHEPLYEDDSLPSLRDLIQPSPAPTEPRSPRPYNGDSPPYYNTFEESSLELPTTSPNDSDYEPDTDDTDEFMDQ